jgi:membrane protease YdiL (CAAX protease family)
MRAPSDLIVSPEQTPDHRPTGQPRGPLAGLGAGWRALLFVAALALTLIILDPPLTAALARWMGMVDDGSRTQLRAGSIALRWVDVLLVLAVTRAFAALEGRDMSEYGLPWRAGALLESLTGMVVGAVAVALVLGALVLAGVLDLGPTIIGRAGILASGAEWAVALLAVAALEEMLFRGYPLATLGRSIGFWPAAVLLSLAFVAAHSHNPGETPEGLAAVFLFGMLFSVIVRRRAAIWLPVGIHAGWDWAQSFLFGVPDSGTVAVGRLFAPHFQEVGWLTGGTAGPEGSVLTLTLLVVAIGLVVRMGAPRAVRGRPSP